MYLRGGQEAPRIITLVLSSWLFLSAQAKPTITVDKLADNVYLYTHNAHRSLFVVTDKAILVTDPQSPESCVALFRGGAKDQSGAHPVYRL